MEPLAARIRRGEHTALLGASRVPSDLVRGIRLVRVRCDGPPTTLGPLDEARRRVEHLLGGHALLLGEARHRVLSGIRRRLLGDVPALALESALVEACNRLAAAQGEPSALALEAVDAADDATLAILRRIVARPGWLKLPLVLAFRTHAIEGAPLALLEALRLAAGPECVLDAAPSEAARASAHEPAPDLELGALPADVRRVLRAGAIVGSWFEADLVAALLEVDEDDVLDALQRGADAGVPIEDNGEGRFRLPSPVLEALRASTLPSLMVVQHRRLAELFGGAGDAEAAASAAPAAKRGPPVEEPPPRVPPVEEPRAEEPPVEEPPPAEPPAEAPPGEEAVAAPEAHTPASWPYAEIFGRGAPEERPAPSSGPVEAPRDGEPRPAPASTTTPAASRAPTAARPDEARAAGHLAAAGDLDASAARYVAAAERAALVGAFPQALALADRALATLDALPASSARRRLRVAAMIEIGRVRWLSSMPDGEATLPGALETLDAAKGGLADDDPVELRAAVATTIAAVCYDVGDAASLERALAELTEASRLLLDTGHATAAARLLNDQAAVYVRMGDPVRATHLLGESRRIFEPRASRDPVAMLEMAETDHLFARIPLHVAARPGREADALTMGLDHALAAQRVYERLDVRRELGRVWETMGRLELRKGRLDRARAHLVEAVKMEEALGDLVGLARSTAALSELLAVSGRHQEAIDVLGDSIALNLEKGSPIGLAFNRRALAALARSDAARGGTAEGLRGLERRLADAERVLGRTRLPGEPDPEA